MQRTDDTDDRNDVTDGDATDSDVTDSDATDSDASGVAETASGIRIRVRERTRRGTRRIFSPRAFLAALGLAVGALVVTSLLLAGRAGGSVAGLGPVFLAGVALGLADWRRYVEVALAGGAAAGVGVILQELVKSTLVGAAPTTVLGAGSGALAAVVGHFLGRKVRHSLWPPAPDGTDSA